MTMLSVGMHTDHLHMSLPRKVREKKRTEYNIKCVQQITKDRISSRESGSAPTRVYVEHKSEKSLLYQGCDIIKVTDYPSRTEYEVPKNRNSLHHLAVYCLESDAERAKYESKYEKGKQQKYQLRLPCCSSHAKSGNPTGSTN